MMFDRLIYKVDFLDNLFIFEDCLAIDIIIFISLQSLMSFERQQLGSSDRKQLGFMLDLDQSFESAREHQEYPQEMSFCKESTQTQSKDHTCEEEEGYEKYRRLIAAAREERSKLMDELAFQKQKLSSSFLKEEYQALLRLSKENQVLRNQIKKKKFQGRKQLVSDKLSARSSFKPRSSINNLYKGEQKTKNYARNKQNSPNMLLKKNENKMAESTANFYGGRSSMHSPKHHKRRQSQLTQRKGDLTPEISMNASILDDGYSQTMRQSLSSLNGRNQPSKSQNNPFNLMLQTLLDEQKMCQQDEYQDLQIQADKFWKQKSQFPQKSIQFVNVLEQKLIETSSRLQNLTVFVHKYQDQIKKLNGDLSKFEAMSTKLWLSKGKYIEMENKCKKTVQLKAQIIEKDQKLRKLKQNLIEDQAQGIVSIETLLRVFTNNEYKPTEAKQKLINYYKDIKQVFKHQKLDQSKRNLKTVKVKELIDNIREGRKKFNELMSIYNARISKLEQKIQRFKFQSQKMQKK